MAQTSHSIRCTSAAQALSSLIFIVCVLTVFFMMSGYVCGIKTLTQPVFYLFPPVHSPLYTHGAGVIHSLIKTHVLLRGSS